MSTTQVQKPETPAVPPVSSAPRKSALAGSSGQELSLGRRLFTHVLLVVICASFVLPFLWMVSTSLKPLEKTMEFPPHFIPDPVQPSNYWKVIRHEKLDFPLLTRNTLIIAVLSVAGTTLSSALVAYGFARIRFKGRGVLFAIMLSTMMIPFPVTMVSLFA